MSSVSSASPSLLNSGSSNWLSDAMTEIKNSQNLGGVFAMLRNAQDGSTGSFLSAASAFANSLATISTNNVSNASAFYAQVASQALQQRNNTKMQQALAELQRQQNMVKPTNVLDSFIYFDDGSSLDTQNNILTTSDGTQIDITTGAKVIDPASIIQMPNGAYLDTKNNILTMADGTQYDTVTGLKLTDLKALQAQQNNSSSDTSGSGTTDTPPPATTDPTTSG